MLYINWDKVIRYVAIFLAMFYILMVVFTALYRLTQVLALTTISLAIFPILPDPLLVLRTWSAVLTLGLLGFWAYVLHFEMINARAAQLKAIVIRR